MNIELPYPIGTKVYIISYGDQIKNICNTCSGTGSLDRDDGMGYYSVACGCKQGVIPSTKEEFHILDMQHTISFYKVFSENKIQVGLLATNFLVDIKDIYSSRSQAQDTVHWRNTQIAEAKKILKELTGK